jgi:hypothetical protein
MPNNTPRREGGQGGSGAIVPYGQQSSQRSSQAEATQRSGRPSQIQVALPGQHREPQPTTSGRSVTGRPSQMQVALPGHNYDEVSRSVYSGRPSQMQVALPGRRDAQTTSRTESSRGSTVRASESLQTSRPQAALPSIREAESSRYGGSSQRNPATRVAETRRETLPPVALPSIRETEPSRYTQTSRTTQSNRSYREPEPNPVVATRYAERPQGGKTCIVRPGEPHHFDSRPDYQRGEMLCTLCRCRDPDSHGDAYTMLNSPRGFDINGRPIDWQEVKKRMLDHYGRDQISHAEELAAVSYVFDAATAREVLDTEEEIKESIRGGAEISVNIQGNRVNWYNDDGHAKPYLTEVGAKTQITRR